MTPDHREDQQVQVISAGILSEHDKALIEAGKKLLVDSIDVGREYCKFMVGVTSGAIPTFIAVLKLGLPDKFEPDMRLYAIWSISPILFLLASLAFSIGYFPATTTVSINNIDGIEAARAWIIRRRKLWAVIGFLLFALGVLSGLFVIFRR